MEYNSFNITNISISVSSRLGNTISITKNCIGEEMFNALSVAIVSRKFDIVDNIINDIVIPMRSTIESLIRLQDETREIIAFNEHVKKLDNEEE